MAKSSVWHKAILVALATLPLGVSLAEIEGRVIPFEQLGSEAGKQYSGDGIGVTVTATGACLRAAFQDLEAEATPEGLWLRSTADEDAHRDVRFRLRAMEVSSRPLEQRGEVRVVADAAAWLRPGLIEEYRTSTDGIRQDFVIPGKAGTSPLSVALELTGARAESAAYGAKLILDGNARELAYNRLHVTDATGRELEAWMEVTGATRIEVQVDDVGAVYPVRIDPTFSDADWVGTGGFAGTNGDLSDMVVDGAGNLYIGGIFTKVGTTVANRIAKWDGSGWSSLGAGIGGEGVHALAISGADLYAAGTFTSAGGVAANNIARWNGVAWSTLGLGTNGDVASLAVSGADLYVGGSFTTAGGVNAKCIAKWNGTSWSALGSGVEGGTYPAVSALSVAGSDLYVGGYFTTAGGVSASRIAKWNGSAWSALGSGMHDISGDTIATGVNALAVSGTDLYAGGFFNTAGGILTGVIAKWDGTSWSALGPGASVPDGPVYALAVSGSDLYVGGTFTRTGVTTVNRIAKWDGSTWSALASGMDGHVTTMAVFGTNVYAGGRFNSAGGANASRVARWNGSDWSIVGDGNYGLGGRVFALAVSGTDVYAGGEFTHAGGVNANRIAKWNGDTWSPLGSGLGGVVYPEDSIPSVNALAVAGTDLYVGGHFSTAGGVSANHVAKWDGTNWTALGSGVGGDGHHWVYALALSGTDLYVGGMFTTAGGIASRSIARWDGAAWNAMSTGMSGPNGFYVPSVLALAVAGTEVYAGGFFTQAGGTAANHIARWNGSDWQALGTGIDDGVSALASSGSVLYAGGRFNRAGGKPAKNVAKWNGQSWSALGGGVSSSVFELVLSGTDLYAAGEFLRAGGVEAKSIARWNGKAWSSLGSGTNGTVWTLAISGNNLYAGGDFATAGGDVSRSVARANIATEILVTGNSNEIEIGDATPAWSDHTDFAGANVSNATVTRTYTISNLGAFSLNLGAVHLTGPDASDFAVSTAPAVGVPPGGSTMFRVTFDPSLPGMRTATVSFAANDADESLYDFSIQGTGTTDSNGNGFSDYEEALLLGLPSRFMVGNTVDLDLGFFGVTGSQKLIVTGLPPGLTFNPISQKIGGVVTGELGDAPTEIRKIAAGVVFSLPFNLSVAPYRFLGTFEGLFENGSLPTGKAKLTITGPGVCSATLERQGETTRSAKGLFPSSGGSTQTVLVTFPLFKGFPETLVTFVVPSTSDLVTGSNEGASLRGFRLAKPGRSPVQRVTVAFNNAVPGNRTSTPGGTGFASGAINSKGLLSLTTTLGDSQRASLALNLSQTNQAVVFAQPYADKLTSFFGGILTIGDLGAPGRGGSAQSQIAGIQWRKAASATATSYKGGFGVITPLQVNGRVSRWVPVATGEGLALSLGLNMRNMKASYTAPPAGVLPSHFALRNTFALIRLLPTNAVSWTGKALPSSGTFSGTLPLSAPAAKTIVSGVLLQDANFGTQVGAGLIKIPIIAPIGDPALPPGSFETAGILFENN